MNTRLPLSLIAVLALGSAAAQAQPSPARTGAQAVPANRIVGLWTTDAAVSPCGSPPPSPQRINTLQFNAGGTLNENPLFPPGGDGTAQRSTGLGTWSYSPQTGQYAMHLRFDRFVNGVYDGYSTVDRSLTLSGDGQQVAGPVEATFFAVDGSVIVHLCGSAVSTRL
jgi:hypothetical protein